MSTYEPAVFLHSAGDTRTYLDKYLIYSLQPGRRFELDRYHTFRAQNGEMSQIYSIEHHLLAIDPAEAQRILTHREYQDLSPQQTQRLRGYINNTSKRFRGYDLVQDYYFLQAAPADALTNRPQMFPHGLGTRQFRREDLLRGGRLS